MRKLVVLFPFLLGALAGCEEEIACTDLLAWSVTIDLQDADGNPVEDAEVTYSADGAAAEPCENGTNGEYYCGPEIAGPLTIVAGKDGLSATMDFDIDADECHVIGESATLTLE